MSRPCLCARCHQYILERGNEIPGPGGLYHRSCYAQVQQENPEELPTLEELQKQIDGVREVRV